MSAPLRIELLGPLQIRWHGQTIAVGAQRLQTLLAVLALRANQVCTAEELLDLVWHDNPPGTGLKVLPPYIYRLRRILPVDVLERTPDGYLLRLPDNALDLTEFETAVRAAAGERDRGELDAAAAGYRRALDLFRGEPLSGLPGQYLAAQRLRLVERRDKIFGDRVDVDLDRGQAAELIAELVPAVAAKPFDEHLAGQLMRALAADGRQADALDVYTRTRDTLIDELGVEPGPALREIQQTILRNDETARTPDELPYAAATFVGREAELARLIQALSSTDASAPPIVAIDGMAGVGKTAIAVNTARRLTTRYPDGLLFVDLHGHTPGHPPRDVKAALDHLLAGVGIGPKSIPQELEDAQTLWRSTVAGRRLLVVLDNAPGSTTVLPLLPGSPSCGVLITSRNQLTGLDTRDRLHLDLLVPADAAALLAQLAGQDRVAADVAASNDLVERCGHLPLAIRIAGARLRHRPAWTVAHINQRLDRVGRRLTELSADGVGVAAAFELSYEQLAPDQQRLFRLLSQLPGRDLDQYGAAALADLDPDDAADLAESLVDANLLLQPVPGRYEFHDLLREYATHLARATDSPETLEAATDRLLEYYLQATFHPLSVQSGMKYFDPGPRPPCAVPELDTLEKSIAWGDAEADNLAAAVERSAASGQHTRTWQLALASGNFLERRGKVQQQDLVLELALAAAVQLGDPEVEARVLHTGAGLIRAQRGLRAAADRFRQALDRLPDDGDLLLRAQIYSGLGNVLQNLDPYGEALPTLLEAIRLARELNNRRLLSQCLTYTAILYANALDHEAATATFEEALGIFRQLGPTGLMADALSGLTHSYADAGRIEDAIATGTAAYELALELKNVFSLPWALGALGLAYRLRGDLERALSLHREGLLAAERCGSIAARWSLLLKLGDSLLAVGDTAAALDCFEQVLDASMADKTHLYMVEAWEGLAAHATAVGDPVTAAGHLNQALAVSEEYGLPHAKRIRARLAELSE
ncbi:BTAD domain-containing putative transcriptional regulator [Kribbella sp. NPDC051952]|uniref:AfsR/SARP family transcriptional regulator n=1 Tax=Kribbella sp. NPDC051952 TaxID=3154851 RepID=UPI003448F96A